MLILKLVARVVAQQPEQFVFSPNRAKHQNIPGEQMPESWWRLMDCVSPCDIVWEDIRNEYIRKWFY